MPAMGTKSREVIRGGRIGGAKMSAEHARQRAIEAAREADRAEAHAWSVQMKGYGGPGTAVTDDRAMHQWRSGLAGGRVQPVQDPGEPAAERHPPAAGYTDLEA